MLLVIILAVMMKKIFKEEESNKILKILGLIKNIDEYQINIPNKIKVAEENISQEFKLKDINETRK